MQIYIFIEPKFRPDKHHLCTVLEAMKVAGETLRRSRRPSPAAGSYLQPCWYSVYELPRLENTKYPQLCLNFRGAQGRSPIKQVYLSAVVMEESGLTV